MMRRRYFDGCFMKFCFILMICMVLLLVYQFNTALNSENLPTRISEDDDYQYHKTTIFNNINSNVILKSSEMFHISPTDELCTYWQCFESSKCIGNADGKLSVYVYDIVNFVDENTLNLIPPPSKEFTQLLWAISNSRFAVRNPAEACIFIPSVDLLNTRNVHIDNIARVLASLPYWNNGSNHLLFNMVSDSTSPSVKTVLKVAHGKAVVASSDFTHHSYRRTFDVSIPFYNPHQKDADFVESNNQNRQYLLISAQTQIQDSILTELRRLSHQTIRAKILQKCQNRKVSWRERCDLSGNIFSYPSILTKARYCLITTQKQLVLSILDDILRAGCVPVVSMNSLVLPFSEVLDWKRAAVFVNEHSMSSILDVLSDIDNDHSAYDNLRDQGQFYYNYYMRSVDLIAQTTLEILNDRILPYRAKSYNQWNRAIIPDMPQNPFFIPLLPSQKQGFTAVVLTYDRLDLMKRVVKNIAGSKYVSKIIVVWNNQQKAIPKDLLWTSVQTPVKVIQTKYNRLSNRFLPYDEIETDCVLAIDDDIIMVPPAELDFGYRVWSENPDRLVGYPPRYHTYNNTEWKYDSEWINNISMVLTGVAFYHKYYHYLFGSKLPPGLKTWIDENMNCEDVAMNYLIANVTGKAPIKILARKKFKVLSSGLSAGILSHLDARSTCMKVFTQAFGVMPLRTVEFRADPLLYKVDVVDDSMKWYISDGAL